MSDGRTILAILAAMLVSYIMTVLTSLAGTRRASARGGAQPVIWYIISVTLGLVGAVSAFATVTIVVGGGWQAWTALCILSAAGLALSIAFYRRLRFWPLGISIAAYGAILILTALLALFGWILSNASPLFELE